MKTNTRLIIPPFDDSQFQTQAKPDDINHHVAKAIERFWALSKDIRTEGVLIELPYLNNRFRHRSGSTSTYAIHALLMRESEPNQYIHIYPGIARTIHVENDKITKFLPHTFTRWDYSHMIKHAYALGDSKLLHLQQYQHQDTRLYLENNHGFTLLAAFSSHYLFLNVPYEQFVRSKNEMGDRIFRSLIDRLTFIPFMSNYSSYDIHPGFVHPPFD